MDLLTRTELLELSARDHQGVHVSMFMPTHRSGSGIEGDQIRWKNALTALESILVDAGTPRPDIEELLAPGWLLQRDPIAWKYMSDGLAAFLRPGSQQIFRIPMDVPELATVGDRFVVGPLLPLYSADEHFLLLAVSQREVRLLEGTRHRVEEIVLPDVPSSLREVVAPPDPRSDTMARPLSTARRGGRAVFYGHGAADDHFKKDEIERFVREVARGLDEYLATQDLPLVLFGLDYLVSLYRSVTTYPHVVEEAVRNNPDELAPEELHAAAWPVISQRLRADKERVVERFRQLHGTGLASTDAAKLEDAAVHGRVETLLVGARPSCWERASTESPRVLRLGMEPAFARCELVDRITIDTLARSGQIYAFTETEVPGGGDVAALFRY